MSIRLLVRPVPVRGELAQGYLVRLVEANALPSPRTLAAIGWSDATVALKQAEGMALVGPLNGLGPLNRPSHDMIPSRFWSLKRPRFCPLCLAEAGYWRGVWGLCFSVACSKHGVKLLDACECGEALRWSRSSLLECRCGQDIRELSAEKASEEALRVAREIDSSWTGCCNGDCASTEALIQVMSRVWLIGAHMVGSGAKKKKLANLHVCERATEVVEAYGSVIANWPTAFYDLLTSIENRHVSTDERRLAVVFGPLYRDIFSQRDRQAKAMLRQAFEDYLGLRWTGQVAKRNRRLSEEAINGHQWIPVTPAAKTLGWRGPRLRRAIASGMVRGYMRQLPSGKTVSVVHRADIERIQEEQKEWTDLKGLCRMLHIGKRRAKQLIDEHKIVPICGPSIDGASVWAFRRNDVIAYTDKLGEAVQDE